MRPGIAFSLLTFDEYASWCRSKYPSFDKDNLPVQKEEDLDEPNGTIKVVHPSEEP